MTVTQRIIALNREGVIMNGEMLSEQGYPHRLQQVSQKLARQGGSTFRQRILSFSDFLRH